MPALYVADIPQELYERIQQSAALQKRSLDAEVISLLSYALHADPQSQARVLAAIRRSRSFSPAQAGAPDSTLLLREDRARH